MPGFRDLTGKRFGRWQVLELVGKRRDARHQFIWRCRCDCGTEKTVSGSTLKLGTSVSCGCYKRERSTTHGMDGTPTYKAWSAMLARCNNPKSKEYHNYGGRGIRVCEAWHKFEPFFADMGERPAGLSIDRIDNDGNYEPENCRWADWKQQNRNRRNNKMMEFRGERISLAELAERHGLGYRLVWRRIKRGLSAEEAVSQNNLRWGKSSPKHASEG
jgi:hypothetical protein